MSKQAFRYYHSTGEANPIYFYHPDHLGTSNALTDANGTMYQFFLNLPFGETMASQSSTSYYQSEFKFNGKELDTETGLYFYGARYYDPSLSVWLSVDPLAEQFPNFSPYNYTMNNPINMVDPDGRAPDVVQKPLDWIKNLKTGKVRWINASGDRAIVGAAAADGRIKPSSPQTDVSSDIKKDYKNLGSDFYATGDTMGDNDQMKAEQLKYITEVASKLEKNAGLDGGLGDANSLPLNYTAEKLKSILMGGKSNSSSNSKSTIDEIINFGKSEIQNHYRDETIEKILNVSGRTVETTFMLFESQDVGKGSDMSARNNLRNQNLFNSRIAPQLDPMTVFMIRLHKY